MSFKTFASGDEREVVGEKNIPRGPNNSTIDVRCICRIRRI